MQPKVGLRLQQDSKYYIPIDTSWIDFWGFAHLWYLYINGLVWLDEMSSFDLQFKQ